MAQLARCMWYKHEVTSLDPQNPYKKLGVVINVYNPNTGEMETEGSMELAV